MKWFGQRRQACLVGDRIDAPIGAECAYCGAAVLASDDGWSIPWADGPAVFWHHICLMMSLGIMPGAHGKNSGRPVISVRHSRLVRYGDSRYKSTCPACREGLLMMQRMGPGVRLSRHDTCTLCCQRVFYTDVDVNGEAFYVPEREVS